MGPVEKPIGLILRKKRTLSSVNQKEKEDFENILIEKKILTLEEEIARLEAEVENTESDNEDDEDSDNSNNDSEKDKDNEEFDDAEGLLRNEGGVLTSLRPELRIAPLPKSLLPASSCKFSDKSKKTNEHKPKKFRIADALTEASVASGLEKTIAEQLRHYQPVSQDKKPFYCRVCHYQGNNVEELESHKETDSHRKAVELERKLSNCSLCKKQFTSPDQLKEHLQGKAHKEKLERAKMFSNNRKFS
jgi:hypothetical protein